MMNRAEKIELLRLIKEGKFDPDWLNIQYIVEQPDGSFTCNGIPTGIVINNETPDEITQYKKKYVKYDFTGVSVEALRKIRDDFRKIKNHE
jgi:hypothetical protein